MSKLYTIIINTLLFFFIVTVVNGVVISGGTVVGKTLAGLVFGLLIMLVPLVLKFFKITVNAASQLLLATLISFLFFFLIYIGVFPFGSIGGSVIDFGFGANSVMRIDPLGTLIFVALFSAVSSTLLQLLSERN